MTLLSTAYLGNIQYYSKLLGAEQVVIEQWENYQKQSFRNRCLIMTAGGVATLSIPVLKTSGEKTAIRDVRIDYSKAWQHQHWYSITSAYRNSPYFEHFEDEFAPFYRKRCDFLWDFNAAIQDTVCRLLGVRPRIEYSSEYIVAGEGDSDFRTSISPKTRLRSDDEDFLPAPYYQVFSDRFDFTANLSIIDMLFCEGKFMNQTINK